MFETHFTTNLTNLTIEMYIETTSYFAPYVCYPQYIFSYWMKYIKYINYTIPQTNIPILFLNRDEPNDLICLIIFYNFLVVFIQEICHCSLNTVKILHGSRVLHSTAKSWFCFLPKIFFFSAPHQVQIFNKLHLVIWKKNTNKNNIIQM